MSEIDYPEEFTPIAAGLKRLPYLTPSPKFADRVISRVARLQSSESPDAIVAQPRLSVIKGGAIEHSPDWALVRSRRRRLMLVAVGVPATVGVLIAVSVLFAQLDVLAVVLGAAAAELAPVAGIIGAGVGNLVLGGDAMAALQAGSVQAAFLYLVMAAGLLAGYSGIRFAAEIARRRAA